MNVHMDATAKNTISAAMTRPARMSANSNDFVKSQTAAIKKSVRQASPSSNVRLKSMLFHATIKRSATEAEFRGGKGDVEVVRPKGAFDHLLFGLFEIEARSRHRDWRPFRPARKREVIQLIRVALGHDDRTFGSMPQCTHVPRPVVSHECIKHVRRHLPLWAIVLACV